MKTVKANCRIVRFFALQFICILLFISIAKSQEIAPAQNFHQWGAVTIFNGLPSDNVRAIAQTLDGVLWFGTDNGLARFDGRRVQTVALETVATTKIFALKTDENGTLWIGTNNGAFFYKNNKFQRIEETKNFAITAILFTESIFLATENGAILKLNETVENSFQIEKIPAENLSDDDGKPLKITSLAKIDGKIIAGMRSKSILIFETKETAEILSRPRIFFVNALAEDAKGNIWLGADSNNAESGFFAFSNIGIPRKIGAETGNVLAIVPSENSVWAGTENAGLFHFQDEKLLEHFTFENTTGGLRSNTIYALFADREGVIWIGTNRGVSRFDASSPQTQILSKDSKSEFVRTIFRASNGQIFAGTDHGLYLFSEGIWLDAGNFSLKKIYAIGEDAAKKLLIGSPNGLFDYDGKQILTGDIRAIVNFKGKTYATIFGRGLIETETNAQVFSNDSPTALFSNSEKLWIGTAKDGVFVFDGKNIRQEKPLDILRGAAIWKIISDDENNLWIAGERGLFRYRNGELETIISNQKVRDVLITGADIWAATAENGLLHLKTNEMFGWISANLNVEQGLPSEQIFALLKEENRLFISTNNGVSIYAPSAISPKIIATRVLSQRLHAADELSQTIALEYPQNGLLTEVSGLSSRTFPEQFQYGFLLKNANGEIIEKRFSNDSQFAPANLKSGAYSIEVRAFNKDLLASEPLTIKFSIARAPFPWTATALGVLLVIALIALVWAFIERRRISSKNRELAAARFDLANEAERERKRIAQDLHDQTLADLRNLMLMSDKLPADNSEFRTEIESVSTEIRRICEDLSPSVLENVGLAAALEFLLSQTIENRKFSADENLEERLNFVPNVQMQIFRIAQEILTNIKQHSDANFVEMSIEILPENAFLLQITDDGIFFNPNEKNEKNEKTPKGRGIANIKSRAALIEAEAIWQKAENGGTLFRLWKSTPT